MSRLGPALRRGGAARARCTALFLIGSPSSRTPAAWAWGRVGVGSGGGPNWLSLVTAKFEALRALPCCTTRWACWRRPWSEAKAPDSTMGIRRNSTKGAKAARTTMANPSKTALTPVLRALESAPTPRLSTTTITNLESISATKVSTRRRAHADTAGHSMVSKASDPQGAQKYT